MSGLWKRCLITIAILFLTAVSIFYYRFENKSPITVVDIGKIPLEFGSWKGIDIPVEDEVCDILETESILMREYMNKNLEKVWFTVVYYQNTRVGFHLPESCSTGQGSFIVERGVERINLDDGKIIEVNKNVLKGDKGNRIMLYFFKTEGLITPSYKNLRFQRVLNKIKHKSNSAALVKFSINIGENRSDSLKVLKQFVKETVPLLSEYLI